MDVYNVFQLTVGLRAISHPNDPSPWDPSITARQMMLELVGQTWDGFFPATENYHLNAPVLGADGNPTGLRYSSEADVAQWLANAAPHQSMRESATPIRCSAIRTRSTCAVAHSHPGARESPPPAAMVPRAAHSVLAQTISTDSSRSLIRTLPVAREPRTTDDADILFASDAPLRAWLPLLLWLYTR